MSSCVCVTQIWLKDIKIWLEILVSTENTGGGYKIRDLIHFLYVNVFTEFRIN